MCGRSPSWTWTGSRSGGGTVSDDGVRRPAVPGRPPLQQQYIAADVVSSQYSPLSTRHSSLVRLQVSPADDRQGIYVPRETYHLYYPHSRVTSVDFFFEFLFIGPADGRRRFIFNYINIPTNVLLFFVNRNKHNRYFTVLQHWSRQRLIRSRSRKLNNHFGEVWGQLQQDHNVAGSPPLPSLVLTREYYGKDRLSSTEDRESFLWLFCP